MILQDERTVLDLATRTHRSTATTVRVYTKLSMGATVILEEFEKL